MSCNGYTNYETWNIDLWVDNDENLYNMKISFLKSYPVSEKIPAIDVKDFYLGIFPEGTPDFEDQGVNIEEINWDELAELLTDERDNNDY